MFGSCVQYAGPGRLVAVMALVALAVRLDSKGPVLYRQTRVGLGGRCFEVWQFRSMSVNAESVRCAQRAQQNDPRVTRVGRSLRKYRLDEFPQLINVIRGDMSFVGPRPERPAFVEMLRKGNTLLRRAAFRPSGYNGMGASALRLRRNRRGRPQEAGV